MTVQDQATHPEVADLGEFTAAWQASHAGQQARLARPAPMNRTSASTAPGISCGSPITLRSCHEPALSLYPVMSSEILGKAIPLYRCP